MLQDPNLFATLTPQELAALNAIADDDLAPPPSQEDIFGQMDVLKSQFEEDNEKIEKQFKENQVQYIKLIFYNPTQFVFSAED